MAEINITPFDNEISILYKWAGKYGIPTYFVVITPEIKGDKQINIYSNGIDLINQRIKEGKKLKDIYREFNNRLETEDITMTYALLSLSNNRPGNELLSEINNLYNTIQEYEEKTVTELQIKDEEEC